MVLFMVHSSLSGFFGSGEIPTSALDRMAATDPSGTRPVNSTNVGEAQPVAHLDELGERVTRTDEDEADVASAQFVHDRRRHLEDDVHPVLRSHHPDVRHQVFADRCAGRGRAVPA